jgi:hypothetical protein
MDREGAAVFRKCRRRLARPHAGPRIASLTDKGETDRVHRFEVKQSCVSLREGRAKEAGGG